MPKSLPTFRIGRLNSTDPRVEGGDSGCHPLRGQISTRVLDPSMTRAAHPTVQLTLTVQLNVEAVYCSFAAAMGPWSPDVWGPRVPTRAAMVSSFPPTA